MKKNRQPKLISYAEYRIREAYDDEMYSDNTDTMSQDTQDNEWKSDQYDDTGDVTSNVEEPNQDWNTEDWQSGKSQENKDLETLGMDEKPTFASMPEHRNEMAAAAGPGPDEDPEDWQAKQDLMEVAGVYGLKLGGNKSGQLVVQGGRLSPWKQEFPDFVSAMQWVKANMGQVGKR